MTDPCVDCLGTGSKPRWGDYGQLDPCESCDGMGNEPAPREEPTEDSDTVQGPPKPAGQCDTCGSIGPEYALLDGIAVSPNLCPDPFHQPPEPPVATPSEGEMRTWDIWTCPKCGEVEGMRGFHYEAAEQAWGCEQCGLYPVQARKVKVIPASRYERLREERDDYRERCRVEYERCEREVEMANALAAKWDQTRAELTRLREERDRFDDEAERLGIERAEAWAERDRAEAELTRLREAVEAVRDWLMNPAHPIPQPRSIADRLDRALSETQEDE